MTAVPKYDSILTAFAHEWKIQVASFFTLLQLSSCEETIRRLKSELNTCRDEQTRSLHEVGVI